jgi:hypothetical protein
MYIEYEDTYIEYEDIYRWMTLCSHLFRRVYGYIESMRTHTEYADTYGI